MPNYIYITYSHIIHKIFKLYVPILYSTYLNYDWSWNLHVICYDDINLICFYSYRANTDGSNSDKSY